MLTSTMRTRGSPGLTPARSSTRRRQKVGNPHDACTAAPALPPLLACGLRSVGGTAGAGAGVPKTRGPAARVTSAGTPSPASAALRSRFDVASPSAPASTSASAAHAAFGARSRSILNSYEARASFPGVSSCRNTDTKCSYRFSQPCGYKLALHSNPPTVNFSPVTFRVVPPSSSGSRHLYSPRVTRVEYEVRGRSGDAGSARARS
mmetsp:Transcript_9630/g.31573  ORF Transcript_9630/g.31573 Transcript_9630/m.31573 type:complete len:206 (+) Transcript_9630:3057-3674(+)